MDQNNEALKNIINSYVDEATKLLIVHAGELFKGKDIRFQHYAGEANSQCMKVILDHKVCLWWFAKDGKWKYDGWEVGDYSRLTGHQDISPVSGKKQ